MSCRPARDSSETGAVGSCSSVRLSIAWGCVAARLHHPRRIGTAGSGVRLASAHDRPTGPGEQRSAETPGILATTTLLPEGGTPTRGPRDDPDDLRSPD